MIVLFVIYDLVHVISRCLKVLVSFLSSVCLRYYPCLSMSSPSKFKISAGVMDVKEDWRAKVMS